MTSAAHPHRSDNPHHAVSPHRPDHPHRAVSPHCSDHPHRPAAARNRTFLTRLGAGPDLLPALTGMARPGRVIRAERSGARVASPSGELSVPYADVAVGDWVELAADGVCRVLPRRTAIERADPGGRSTTQVLAANVDTVLICTPRTAAPRVRRLERLLAVTWSSGAEPVMVATKADLSSADLEPLRRAAPGVPVIATTPDDVSGLLPYLGPGRTLAVLGASGVGKSTLANALLGRQALHTAPIRRDGKGRHTTAWRELLVLPDGGALIDTPGLRGIGLAAGDEDGVTRAFADVADLAVDCRFRDCSHNGEPDCAVAGAVESGVLDPRRVDDARRLHRELAWQAAKSDARLRAERNRQWRRASREYRSGGSR